MLKSKRAIDCSNSRINSKTKHRAQAKNYFVCPNAMTDLRKQLRGEKNNKLCTTRKKEIPTAIRR